MKAAVCLAAVLCLAVAVGAAGTSTTTFGRRRRRRSKKSKQKVRLGVDKGTPCVSECSDNMGPAASASDCSRAAQCCQQKCRGADLTKCQEELTFRFACAESTVQQARRAPQRNRQFERRTTNTINSAAAAETRRLRANSNTRTRTRTRRTTTPRRTSTRRTTTSRRPMNSPVASSRRRRSKKKGNKKGKKKKKKKSKKKGKKKSKKKKKSNGMGNKKRRGSKKKGRAKKAYILQMETPYRLTGSPKYRKGKSCTLKAPSGGVLISKFGSRLLPTGARDNHKGIDIQECSHDKKTRDETIVAAADGIVVRMVRGCPDMEACKSQSGKLMHSGNEVVIAHPKLGVFTSYSHLDDKKGLLDKLGPGDPVKSGTKLGRMGKSGSLKLAWRDILHFQVMDKNKHPLDPCKFLNCPKVYGRFKRHGCSYSNSIKCRFHVPNKKSRFCRPLTKKQMTKQNKRFRHPLPKHWNGFVSAFEKFINKLHKMGKGAVPSWNQLPKCQLPKSCPKCKAREFPYPCLSTKVFKHFLSNPQKTHELYKWLKKQRSATAKQGKETYKDWDFVWRLYFCSTGFRLKDSGGSKFFLFTELHSAARRLPVSPATLLEESSSLAPNQDLTPAQQRACALCSDTATMAIRLLNQYNMTTAAVQQMVDPICQTIRSQGVGKGLKCEKLLSLLDHAAVVPPRPGHESDLHGAAQQYARALPWCHAAGLHFCRATVTKDAQCSV